jgi:hypothetical protein
MAPTARSLVLSRYAAADSARLWSKIGWDPKPFIDWGISPGQAFPSKAM